MKCLNEACYYFEKVILTQLLLVLLPIQSCHLVLGIKKEKLPEIDSSVQTCRANSDCDDGHECTRDLCELSTERCKHILIEKGTTCRASKGECDIEEVCDGQNKDCPEDSFKPSTEICRQSAGNSTDCDPPEYCTGNSPQCPEDTIADEGSSCDDGNQCTYNDICDGEGNCSGINGLTNIIAVDASKMGFHTCGIIKSGRDRTVKCWGLGSFYQLGNGSTENSRIPVKVSGLPEGDYALQVTCGGNHTCVLLHSGKILCWGGNEFSQLGVRTSQYCPQPVHLQQPPYNWDYISAGQSFTCAIHRTEGLMCWGKNDRGQLGNGTTENSTGPVTVNLPSGQRALTVSVSSSHCCAILNDGKTLCWGDNSAGQLGRRTTEDYSEEPAPVEGLPPDSGIRTISTGALHTCAVLSDGRIMCWGDNSRKQLGCESCAGSQPVEVALSKKAVEVCSGGYHNCALLENGEVYCWGAGDKGQLGNTTQTDSTTPTKVMNLTEKVTKITCGAVHSCAVVESKTVYCWGGNNAGQLGDGTNQKSLTPSQVKCE